MRSQGAVAVLAGALLALTSFSVAADETEHVRKQTRTLQMIDAMRDPEVTGSITRPDDTVRIDVRRPTRCNVQVGHPRFFATELKPVSRC